MEKHADVDAFLACTTRWHDEVVAVRAILRDCGLTEQIKWGKPCYGHDGANLVILQPFKDSLALLFFKGALLEDPEGRLESQGENTRAARRLLVRSVAQVADDEALIRAYVARAVAVEEAGLEMPERPALELAQELRDALDADPALKAAFEGLTPGRQREYDLFVSGAKQSRTRAARVAKHVDRILAGKGMRDR